MLTYEVISVDCVFPIGVDSHRQSFSLSRVNRICTNTRVLREREIVYRLVRPDQFARNWVDLKWPVVHLGL